MTAVDNACGAVGNSRAADDHDADQEVLRLTNGYELLCTASAGINLEQQLHNRLV
jgi:hypothetical protein